MHEDSAIPEPAMTDFMRLPCICGRFPLREKGQSTIVTRSVLVWIYGRRGPYRALLASVTVANVRNGDAVINHLRE